MPFAIPDQNPASLCGWGVSGPAAADSEVLDLGDKGVRIAFAASLERKIVCMKSPRGCAAHYMRSVFGLARERARDYRDTGIAMTALLFPI